MNLSVKKRTVKPPPYTQLLCYGCGSSGSALFPRVSEEAVLGALEVEVLL